FLKTATQTLSVSGIGAMLTDWPVYAFIAATITGALLQQGALHVGPLAVSQPLLVITDPFASIILSVWLFGEHFTDSPAKVAIAVLAFAVMAAGSPCSPGQRHRISPRPARPPAEGAWNQPGGFLDATTGGTPLGLGSTASTLRRTCVTAGVRPLGCLRVPGQARPDAGVGDVGDDHRHDHQRHDLGRVGEHQQAGEQNRGQRQLHHRPRPPPEAH